MTSHTNILVNTETSTLHCSACHLPFLILLTAQLNLHHCASPTQSRHRESTFPVILIHVSLWQRGWLLPQCPQEGMCPRQPCHCWAVPLWLQISQFANHTRPVITDWTLRVNLHSVVKQQPTKPHSLQRKIILKLLFSCKSCMLISLLLYYR